jgi:predicted phosphate transport protein (TIGR00153 family)
LTFPGQRLCGGPAETNMALQDLVRWLLPREQHFFDYLENQARVVHLGAVALAEFASGSRIEDVQSAVQELEHEGDKVVHDLEEALGQTFVTPIDREDIQHLSSEIDDVIDLMNSAARACLLFGVTTPTEAMRQLMGVLVRTTAALAEALPNLGKHDYPALMAASRTIRQLEKEADQVFRSALSHLFHDEGVDAKSILREKEVLENLEHAIDRCERVAHTLAMLAIKHG